MELSVALVTSKLHYMLPASWVYLINQIILQSISYNFNMIWKLVWFYFIENSCGGFHSSFADYGHCAKLLCGEWTLKLNIFNQQFTKMIQYLWRAEPNNVCIQGVLSNQQTELFRLLNFHCTSIHFIWKTGNFITCMCLIKITDIVDPVKIKIDIFHVDNVYNVWNLSFLMRDCKQ